MLGSISKDDINGVVFNVGDNAFFPVVDVDGIIIFDEHDAVFDHPEGATTVNDTSVSFIEDFLIGLVKFIQVRIVRADNSEFLTGNIILIEKSNDVIDIFDGALEKTKVVCLDELEGGVRIGFNNTKCINQNTILSASVHITEIEAVVMTKEIDGDAATRDQLRTERAPSDGWELVNITDESDLIVVGKGL